MPHNVISYVFCLVNVAASYSYSLKGALRAGTSFLATLIERYPSNTDKKAFRDDKEDLIRNVTGLAFGGNPETRYYPSRFILTYLSQSLQTLSVVILLTFEYLAKFTYNHRLPPLHRPSL